MKMFIVTCVDYSETCDGKARVLDVFKSETEAKMFVDEDMNHWESLHAGDNLEIDHNKMSAYDPNADEGCEWNISQIRMS